MEKVSKIKRNLEHVSETKQIWVWADVQKMFNENSHKGMFSLYFPVIYISLHKT